MFEFLQECMILSLKVTVGCLCWSIIPIILFVIGGIIIGSIKK